MAQLAAMKAATKLASGLPFGELDRLVKAIGECKSKSEEDRIILAEVDTLKQRLSDPRLDKTRGREYMVRVLYCELLGHDASFALIPALQLASDPALATKKAAYLALSQLLHRRHELVLLLVNTLLTDLKSDNWVTVATGLVVTSQLIGPDLVNAVLPVVVERLGHAREGVRKKAVMALSHFLSLDPDRSGPLAGFELERHLRAALCDREPSVMAASLNGLTALAARDPAPLRPLLPSLTSILKQVVEHRLPKGYDYHRFPAPFVQIKLLKLLRLLAAGDAAASANVAGVVAATLRRALAGGGHTIGHAIVYEAVRTITALHLNPQLLAAAAEAVAGLLAAPAPNLKYVGLTALAGITRVAPQYALDHQLSVIQCLDDPDDTLQLQTLGLLVVMTRPNNVQVVVERLLAFMRSPACAADDTLRRSLGGRVVGLAERYAPDTTWFVSVMVEVFQVGGDVLQPELAHNLCRLIAEQDRELHLTAVKMFLAVLDRGGGGAAPAPGASGGGASGGGGVLPDLLLCCICWCLGEYGSLAAQLPPPHAASIGQVSDKLCAAVASSPPGSPARGYLLTALTKLAVQQQQQAQAQGRPGGSVWRPDAAELLHQAASSSVVELQQRAAEAQALLGLPAPLLSAVLPLDSSCEELEPAELDEARSLSWLEGYVSDALAAGAAPYNPPLELCSVPLDSGDDDAALAALVAADAAAAAGAAGAAGHGGAAAHKLRFTAYEPAPPPPSAATAASAAGGAFGSASFGAAAAGTGQQPGGGGAPAAAAAAAAPQQPQLVLRGAAKGRWGPADFGGGSGGSSSSSSSAAAPAAAAGGGGAPVAPAPGAGSSRPAGGAAAAGARTLSERDRQLAASLFGGGAAGSAAAGAAAGGLRGRGGGAAAAPKPAAAPVVADLLGGDLTDEPAAAAAAGAGGAAPAAAAGGLDLLLDLSPTPSPAAPAPPAPAAAPLDLLADLAGPAPSAAAAPAPAPAAAAAAAGGGGSGLLDLDSILGSPGPVAGAAPAAVGAVPAGGGGLAGLSLGPAAAPQPQPQQPQQPAGGAGRPLAMRGGQPAKGAALAHDPFKDLLG